MNTRNLFFTLVLLLVGTTACEDDFIGRTPVYSIDSENYFNAEADYENDCGV
jgi:hypothetical protein